jgi:transposase
METSKHNMADLSAGMRPEEMSREQLEAEVLFLRNTVSQCVSIIAALQREVAELKLELARLKKDSGTSSKPPSSDIVKPRKDNTKRGKRKKGGQPGHPRHERSPFAPEAIAKTHFHELRSCPNCNGKDLIPMENTVRTMQQVEALIKQALRVEEHRSQAYFCASCGEIHYAPLPPAVEKGGLIGPVLTAQIAYMKGAMHASFTTIRKYIRDVMGLTLSRGYLSKLLGKVSDALEGPYVELLALLRGETSLNVDETGHKDNGARFWTWCFRAKEHCVFKVASTRSTQVLLDVLGEEFAGVLGCDHFSAYRKYLRECDVRIQFCLAHFIREIKFLTTLPDPAAVDYGQRLLEKFRALFYVLHNKEIFSPGSFVLGLAMVRDALVAEAQRDVPEVNEAQLIAKRLRKYETEYFEFMRTPEIEPTNNPAEQAIRFVTIDRQITQGTRSEKGRQWSERIWTLLATCSIQGRSAYDYLVEVMQAHFNDKPIPSLMPHPT